MLVQPEVNEHTLLRWGVHSYKKTMSFLNRFIFVLDLRVFFFNVAGMSEQPAALHVTRNILIILLMTMLIQAELETDWPVGL